MALHGFNSLVMSAGGYTSSGFFLLNVSKDRSINTFDANFSTTLL